MNFGQFKTTLVTEASLLERENMKSLRLKLRVALPEASFQNLKGHVVGMSLQIFKSFAASQFLYIYTDVKS